MPSPEFRTSVNNEATKASLRYAKLKPSVISANLCGKVGGVAAAGLLDSLFLESGLDD